MIQFTTIDAVVAVIGSIGVLASAVVLSYAFGRNRTGKGDWQ